MVYINRCEFCGKRFKRNTRKMFCCDECRSKGTVLRNDLKRLSKKLCDLYTRVNSCTCHISDSGADWIAWTFYDEVLKSNPDKLHEIIGKKGEK